MDEDDPKELSRRLNRYFRHRERTRTEELRAHVGSEVLGKLDRITQRDLGLQLRDQELNAMGDVEVGKKAPKRTYRVMVNMRSGERARRPATFATEGGRRKRASINELRRSGQKAIQRLRKGVEQEARGRVLNSFWLTHSLTVEVDQDGLVELAARADVRSVNHDKHTIALALDVSRPLIRADQVENTLGITGQDVTVAVLDTGIDLTHAALAPAAGNQFDFTGEGVGDFHGHGTHCGGIVASNDKVRRGVAPGCTLHDYKLMDANGSANATTCITAIQQAMSDGVDVLSNSWGFTHANGAWTCADGTCVLCTAANAAIDGRSIFVAAAGNDDNDSCSTYDTHVCCPGHATQPITVAASDDSDAMADFSSLGPTADGRPKPDITAPGVKIVSARSSTGSDMGGQAPVVDGVWCEVSGTSQATPHVAGVCALMLERNRELTPQQVKDVIMNTAVNIGASADEMGAGRVDALAAVSAV